METAFRALIPAAMVILALAPAPALAADDLPDSGVIINLSGGRWLIKLDNDEKSQVGSIAFGDPYSNQRVTQEIKTRKDEFRLPPSKSFSIFFKDAPSTLLSFKGDRCHRRTFQLIDESGRKLVLESFRKVAPLSNVFIRVSSPVPAQNLEDLRRQFVLNDGEPGSITIKAAAVPEYVPQ